MTYLVVVERGESAWSAHVQNSGEVVPEPSSEGEVVDVDAA